MALKIKDKARRQQARLQEIDDFEDAAGRMRNRPAQFTQGLEKLLRNARARPDATSTIAGTSARRRLRGRPEPGPFTAALEQVRGNERRRRARVR